MRLLPAAAAAVDVLVVAHMHCRRRRRRQYQDNQDQAARQEGTATRRAKHASFSSISFQRNLQTMMQKVKAKEPCEAANSSR